MRMNLARPLLPEKAAPPVRQQTIPYQPTAPSGSAAAVTATSQQSDDSDTVHAMQLMRAQNKMLTKVQGSV